MKSGPAEVAVTPGAMVKIVADHTFTVYGCDKQGPVAILGPSSETDRYLKSWVPQGVSKIKIKCGERTKWVLTETIRNSQEIPDTTPVELGMKHERPLTIQEEMKRFIREEVSRHAQEKGEAGTFEEEDDFDIPDEDEIFSPYEYHDMPEEMPEEAKTVTTTEEPGASCPAASVPDSSTKPPEGGEQNENPPAATEPAS